MTDRLREDGRARLAPAILLVAALISVSAGVAAFTMSDRTYESSATVAIDQVQGIAVAEGPSILEKLSRLRVKYAGLVGTRTFSEPVAERAGVTPEAVTRALFSEVPPVALIMTLGARADDAGTAQAIAQGAADHLVAYVAAEQEQAQIPPAMRFEFRVVTPATEGRPLDRSVRRVALVAIGLGGLLVLAAAVVRFGRA